MFEKNYKKGMADGAKAYESFGKKQEDALNFVLEEVRQGKKELAEIIQEFDGNLNGLYEHLRSQEKAQLYTTYTPFDIKELGGQERQFLLGALYCLAMERTPNENQQKYLRAIQKYLDIKEPPMGVDPLMIENIEDISAQKSILQAVLEFLYLQEGDCYAKTELQKNFLDAFNINTKGFQTIANHVELLYNATGAQGLAEKYGYVPEDECTLEGDIEETRNTAGKQDMDDTTPQDLENMIIQTTLYIPENETKTFSHKRLHICAFLDCVGQLEFDSCEIYYHESDVWDIALREGASIVFINCTFICKDYYETPFIKAVEECQVIFNNCVFKDCSRFLDACYIKEIFMENCQINDCCDYFIKIHLRESSHVSISKCKITENSLREFYQNLKNVGPLICFESSTEVNSTITDTHFIQGKEFNQFFGESTSQRPYYLMVNGVSIENCTCINATNLFFCNGASMIKNCNLKDCCGVIRSTALSPVSIEHCNFEHCTKIAFLIDSGKISYCNFSNCFDGIICHESFGGGISIESCSFDHLHQFSPNLYFGRIGCTSDDNAFIFLTADSKYFSKVSRCIFDGLHLDTGLLISSTSHYKILSNKPITIEDCHFKNCTTQRMDKKLIKTTACGKSLFGRYSDYEVIDIQKCPGLDKVSDIIFL